MENEQKIVSFSPREIVSELDRYVIGQADAKKAVAIALRNRWRTAGVARRFERRSSSKKYINGWSNRCWKNRNIQKTF